MPWRWTVAADVDGAFYQEGCEDAVVGRALQSNPACAVATPWGPVYFRDGMLTVTNDNMQVR